MSRAKLFALLDTLVFPIVLLGWALSGLGCMGWAIALLFLLPAIVTGSFGAPLLGLAIVVWTGFAIVLGWWNMGRTMRWLAGEGRYRDLGLIVVNSALLIALHPFWYARALSGN